MRLLQVTAVFLLLSSLYSSHVSSDLGTTSPTLILPTNSTTNKPSSTQHTKPATDPVHPTPEIPKETVSKDSSEISLVSSVTSVATAKSVANTVPGGTQNELITTNATATTLPFSDAVSTSKGFQPTTENQSSIKMTTMTASTQQPGASLSETTVLPLFLSTAVTPPRNLSQLQGIILPVVIALIVITLSVFVLVGLYRMCWKKDPGAPENGNDQPQSDKESVKLLTVKTISHESGLNLSNCIPGMEMEEVWPNQS
ncbi:endomucin isoform 3-T3 [Thomomys bottae]